jgi:hypothetical protein
MRKFAFAFLFFLVACFDSDHDHGFQSSAQAVQHVPVISNLRLSPGSAEQMQGDGTLTVTATFDFEDSRLDIASMQVDVSDGTSVTINFAQSPATATGTISEQFDISTVDAGSLDVDICISDAAGDISNHLIVAFPVSEVANPHPPQISNLEIVPTFLWHMEDDGTTTATATFDYSDVGLDITTMHVEISDGSSSAIDLMGTINTETGSISQQINVPTTNVGTYTVTIWIVDVVGDESNRLDRNVVVVNDVSGESDWIPRVTGLAEVLNDVLWNGNEFLAVGNRGTILRSADGIDWTSVDSETVSNLHAIAWNGFTYAVVGDAATVLVSDDGENWTHQSGGFGLPYHAVAYSDTLLVAGGWLEFAGPGTYIRSSADNGVTMVDVNVLPQSGRAITDIAWGDGTFVATTVRMESGDNREARMLTSVDGLVWTEVVASTEAIGTFSILWDGDLFWAGGRVGRIYTSPDGNTWTEIQTRMQASIFTGIAESGEALIADGYNEWIGWGPVPGTGAKTEDDGLSWTTFVIERDFDTNGLAYGNGHFVAVGCSGDEYACSDFGGEVEGAIYSTP